MCVWFLFNVSDGLVFYYEEKMLEIKVLNFVSFFGVFSFINFEKYLRVIWIMIMFKILE